MFFQFKLSECLKRKSAKEAASLGVPYFRMSIRSPKYSPQHKLLVELEGKHPGSVYYAAPRFHTPDELDDEPNYIRA